MRADFAVSIATAGVIVGSDGLARRHWKGAVDEP